MSAPLLANALWLLSSLPDAISFRRATLDVGKAQWQVLRRILRANAGSDFGRRYDFASIGSATEFQRRLPIDSEATLRVDVQRVAAGATNLRTTAPVTHLVPTSGTTSEPKLIPFTSPFQRDLQRAISPWIADLFLHDPRLLQGSAYWSVSPVLQEEKRTPAGIPIGFSTDDQYLGGWRSRLVGSLQCVPPEVARVPDLETFRYVTLFFLLSDRRLALLSVWNPTFLMLLMSSLREMGPLLARDIAGGTISRAVAADEVVESGLRAAARSRASVRRAEEVATALGMGTAGAIHAALWPRLRVISCWMDAQATQPAQDLALLFPQARLQAKGLLSTEGFVSFPLSAEGGSVLAIRTHFFEFRDVESDEIFTAQRLVAGRRYSVMLTTSAGLYRYPTGDVVEITGFLQSCPLLRFRGRENYVDHFGEKLSETFVGEAMRSTIASYRFAMLAREDSAPAYSLYVESSLGDGQLTAAARALDDALQANVHYRYCRDLGQLEPLRLYRLNADSSEAYLTACIARGQRAGDVKSVALDGGQGWSGWLPGRWVGMDPH